MRPCILLALTKYSHAYIRIAQRSDPIRSPRTRPEYVNAATDHVDGTKYTGIGTGSYPDQQFIGSTCRRHGAEYADGKFSPGSNDSQYLWAAGISDGE